MESSMCSQKAALSFVIPDGLTKETCEPSLVCAYQACVENELNPQWRTAEECLGLQPTKQDAFVCEPFEGDAFNYLKSDNFKCIVIGPRCLLSCLHCKLSIPELPSPIHNISMHRMIITLTGFEKEKKEIFRNIITRSSGIYSNNFSDSVTHLVADTVGSPKYMVAVEREVPIMTGEWLTSVWKAVCKDFRRDVSATDEQFLSYKCPVFKKLVICVSQMPRKAKDALKKKIEENGGIYSASLDMHDTSILIVPTPEGEKYKFAKNWRIMCLTPDWINDSVEIGHALDMKGYEVEHTKASTPTDDNLSNVPPDISVVSTIMNETGQGVIHVNETLQQTVLHDSTLLRRNSMLEEHVAAVDDIDLAQAMKAGHFLDGCIIFLSGFGEKHTDILRKVFNAGGATRFSQLTPSVSHIIIGKVIEEHMNTISSWTSKPHVVYPSWIVESIRLKMPAEESQFLYTFNVPSVPKPLRCMARRSSAGDNDVTYVDEDLLHQYVKPAAFVKDRKSVGNDETVNMSCLPDSQDTTPYGIFYGKMFTLSGYNQKITEDYTVVIREHSGEVVSLDYKGYVHYSITNLEGTGPVHAEAAEVVTISYIQDCLNADRGDNIKLLDVQYYHLPLRFNMDLKPLIGCTCTISTYTSFERQFIVNLASCLGAHLQESFSKKRNVEKNIHASTHLICSAPSGTKYNASRKWNIPAVTHHWLLDCLRSGERAKEGLYCPSNTKQIILDGKKIIKDMFYNQLACHHTEKAVASDSIKEMAPFTPVNMKIQALRERDSYISPSSIKTPDIDTIRRMYPTPGVSRANDSVSNMKTPDTPYGITWNPNPSASTRKAYKRILDALPDEPPAKHQARLVDPGTPLEEYYKKFNQKVLEQIKNCETSTPVLVKKSMSRIDGVETLKEKKETEPQEEKGPLHGVVVYTAQKLIDQQRTLYEAVKNLGGDYRMLLDESVTHFIFRGQQNDRTKEFRVARDEGKFIVDPEWVWMCQHEQKKIDEDLFPHTNNPKTTLSLSILTSKMSSMPMRGRTKEKHDSSIDTSGAKDQGDVDNTELNESFAKQLEEIKAILPVSGLERRNSKGNKSISEKLKVTPQRSIHYETQPATVDVPDSQSTSSIAWVDPKEEEARQELKAHSTRDTQDIINDNMQYDECEEDKKNLSAVSEAPSQDETSAAMDDKSRNPDSSPLLHHFMISGSTDDEKEQYGAIVIGLGGSLSCENFFDNNCTHLVTTKPTRNEKTLAAVASGKWVLRPSYLMESAKAGRFLEELPFEWGNINSMNIPKLEANSTEYRIAVCARRWRQLLCKNRERKGAYHGMKAIVHTEKNRFEAFARLIAAGGGEVIVARPPYQDVEDVTHVFVESHKNPAKVDMARFAMLKIPCIEPPYLHTYLVSDPPPDVSDHFIPEYRKILEDMNCAETSLIKRKKK
ncbi:hypothetical protein SK128_007595 [Halocaridina rubra]|uniref:BRCT domain-containing protein n=1 Tax=Halocaridina rubra TaxID=373956 RepID=A0AAN8WGM9_HALRR